MILRSAARTDVGLRRRANEDRFAIAAPLGLYLVADGMGGHTAGQVASDLAAQSAVRALETLEGAEASLTEKLRYSVAAANREIFGTAQAKPHLAGMGYNPRPDGSQTLHDSQSIWKDTRWLARNSA